MENLISSIVKLRHPFSALLGVGIGLTIVIVLIDLADLSTAEVTMVALSAIAAGAGIGGLTAWFCEWGWWATRPWRDQRLHEFRRQNVDKKIAALPTDVRELIGQKVARDSYQSPSLEFAYAEMHYAQRLVRAGLLQPCPNPVCFQLSLEAWDVLCDDPARFGLRKHHEGGRRGTPDYRFRFVGLDQ